uniref:Uncharacterized protein n=1 Tax=Arundo donax TaxID=35708 RepID=A0A0A9DHQ0_ARUDO
MATSPTSARPASSPRCSAARSPGTSNTRPAGRSGLIAIFTASILLIPRIKNGAALAVAVCQTLYSGTGTRFFFTEPFTSTPYFYLASLHRLQLRRKTDEPAPSLLYKRVEGSWIQKKNNRETGKIRHKF